MMNSKEEKLLQQMHSIINELEGIISKEERIVSQEDVQASKLELFLRLSCENYWEYDVIKDIVTIFHFNKEKKIEKQEYTMQVILAHVNTDDVNAIYAGIQRLKLGQSDIEHIVYQSEHSSGIHYYDIVAGIYHNNENKEIIGVTKSIKLLNHRMEEVLLEQKKFDLLMSLSNMFIWEYDVASKKFSGNKALCDKLGLETKKYDIDELQEYIEVKELPLLMKHIEERSLSEHAVAHVNIFKTQFELIFETNFKAVTTSEGSYSMIIGTMYDNTEKELLKTTASKDALTGCLNRRTADITLVSTFQKFVNEENFYTIIFFDVDKFKQVNDRFGHDVGDYVLKQVCVLIQKEIRSSDMLFRWGGDEFLLICSGIAKENIYAYIDRLRRVIENSKFEFNREKLHVTLSIGAAYYYRSDHDYQQAMKRADRSVYKAKLAGRNKVCILK